jgi:uncharacterized membrane protein
MGGNVKVPKEVIDQWLAEGLIKPSEASAIADMTRMEATKYFADKLRTQEQEWLDGKK